MIANYHSKLLQANHSLFCDDNFSDTELFHSQSRTDYGQSVLADQIAPFQFHINFILAIDPIGDNIQIINRYHYMQILCSNRKSSLFLVG